MVDRCGVVSFMTNKYFTSIDAIFDRITTDLQAVTSIKQVVKGKQFKIYTLPIAVVEPETGDMGQATLGSRIETDIYWNVYLIIKETEPADFFDTAYSLIGDVIDKILSDRTLNGTVLDTTPVNHAVGAILHENRSYYGARVRFKTKFFFSP